MSLKARSLKNNDEHATIIFVDGQPYYLTSDDIEYYITRFLKMKEQLSKEKKLRKEYPFVKKCYDEYKLALSLCKDPEKNTSK